VPGDSCVTPGVFTNSFIWAGGPQNGGVTNGMFCNGTTWTGAINFQSSGHVGIGTTTPATKLDVNGTIRFAYGGEACAAGTIGGLYYSSATHLMYGCLTAGSWTQIGSAGAVTAAGATTQVQFNSGGNLGASANYTWNNGTQVLTIAGSGSVTNATSGGTAVTGAANTGAGVGIEGTTSSTTAAANGVYGLASGASGATYGVYGSDGSATGFGGYFTNTNGGYALVTNAGNVGIGTTSPAYQLEVDTSGTTAVHGTTSSTTSQAAGVQGYATGATGATHGVYGQTASTTTNAVGVFGRGAGATGATYGVYGDGRQRDGIRRVFHQHQRRLRACHRFGQCRHRDDDAGLSIGHLSTIHGDFRKSRREPKLHQGKPGCDKHGVVYRAQRDCGYNGQPEFIGRPNLRIDLAGDAYRHSNAWQC
jgi:hypothetical protein